MLLTYWLFSGTSRSYRTYTSYKPAPLLTQTLTPR